MSETKRQYKKAGPNDKRKTTSKLNLQKARERKLELLRKAKEIEEKDPVVTESESESESDDSSESDEDVIVIAPKQRVKKEEDSGIRKELSELKAMLAKKNKKRQPKKKQIINILPANPQATAEPKKDAGFDLFKKLLLSQCK